MARALAEGSASVDGVEAEVKKIGEPFPLTKLSEADAVAFGSPVIYANVTEGLRYFIENVKCYIDAGKMDLKGKRAAVFGSYGYDGAWVMEEQLKQMVKDLGYNVQEKVCVVVDSDLRYHPAKPIDNCLAFGRELSESLKKK